MSFDRVGLHPAAILLPDQNVSRETWACVACDQYTSEPEYWNQAEQIVGNSPSALRLILPECFLKDSDTLIPRIHQTMSRYLDQKILYPAVENGMILCERSIASGVRTGLVCAVDLEQYSFEAGSLSLVRPTEQTIASRLPARLAIRRNAPLELTHIMILIDDPDGTVIEPIRDQKSSLARLYDFDLMLEGGHLTGYAVDQPEQLNALDHALNALLDRMGPDPLFLAVGDGNHSLATAKAYWEEIKPRLSPSEQAVHPARFALAEIVNIHDPALLFEPIHRIITGTSPSLLTAEWNKYAEARGMSLCPSGAGHSFTLISEAGEETVTVVHPEGAIPCETLQKFLDDFLAGHPSAGIDYIHGDQSLRRLAAAPDTVGFLLPEINKHTFFEDVKTLGVLPRKTFSMGEADEKRFYMEAKRI